MMTKLFILFTVVPAIELWLLFQVGSFLGFWQTILLILVTGLIGASMAKQEGLSVLKDIQSAPAKGIPIGEKIGEGVLVLIGGVLLITPGILTDFFGLSLIFPLTRRQILPLAKKLISANFSSPNVQFHSNVDFSQSDNPSIHDNDLAEKFSKHHKKGFKHPTF